MSGGDDRSLASSLVRRHPGCGAVERLGLAKLEKFATFCKFLAGSFSAVSKRNFARKYAFDSIFQALQDLHTSAPLQSQKFCKKREEDTESAMDVRLGGTEPEGV